MLFHLSWEFVDSSEDAGKRSLSVLGDWQPPAGLEFRGFYSFADGSGGVAIVEVDSAATIGRATAPFLPWLRFAATPILPMEEATAIAAEAIAYRDSVG